MVSLMQPARYDATTAFPLTPKIIQNARPQHKCWPGKNAYLVFKRNTSHFFLQEALYLVSISLIFRQMHVYTDMRPFAFLNIHVYIYIYVFVLSTHMYDHFRQRETV